MSLWEPRYVYETPPAGLAVSLAHTKEHLRVTHANDDAMITRLIGAATEDVQRYLNRQLVDATITYFQDQFPSAGCLLVLPLPPFKAISEIRYLPADGSAQATFDISKLVQSTSAEPGTIIPKNGEEWPAVLEQRDAIEIDFTAGYGAADTDVPDVIRTAIMARVHDVYWGGRGQVTADSLEDNPAIVCMLDSQAIRMTG